ncbi:MAG: transcriptional regulator FeaR [Acidobacteria bacterium]|nr:MAG: transcriptional regulator FeaR [Acidobacteriota bacterium]
MSQLFKTDRLPASDRFDAWQWNAQQICGDCRIQLPKSSFHGAIEVRHIGGLPLTRFSSSPIAFWKWPSDSASPDNRCCIVITQIAGTRRYVQNGSAVLLSPGDSTLIDSGRPWSSTCETECARLYLRVPRWMMENRLRLRELPIAQRICGSGGVGALLSRLSQSLYEEAEQFKEEEGAAALDAYFQVLSACIGRSESAEHGHAQLRPQIRKFIEHHLSDPGLRPAEIAAAVDISIRHLHRLFSNSGSTLGECIRARRLEQCRNDLANPSLSRKTITEIAFSWGFSDSAHFSRSFHKQFGISPRNFRAQIGIKEWSCNGDRDSSELLRPRIAETFSKPN